jgi:hypothetical protein
MVSYKTRIINKFMETYFYFISTVVIAKAILTGSNQNSANSMI